MTPLAWAANKGGFDSVKLLLQSGADVRMANKDGWTPLHWASHSGHAAIVELLLSYGADPNVRNKLGRLPSQMTEKEAVKNAFLVTRVSGKLGAVPAHLPRVMHSRLCLLCGSWDTAT